MLRSIDAFDAPDRTFQVWFYTVGMRRLILRSTKNEGYSTRIDVLFQGVAHLTLPTLMVGLSVQRAGSDEQRTIEESTGLTVAPDERVYVLQGQAYVGYVVALAMVTHEDALDYDSPSGVIEDVLMRGSVR